MLTTLTMPPIFKDTQHFHSDNNESVIEILGLFCHVDDELKFRIICPSCKRIPSTIHYNGNESYEHIVRLVCNHCSMNWNLCRKCPCAQQYQFSHICTKRDQSRMNRLSSQVHNHNRLHHSSTTDAIIIREEDDGIGTNNDTVDIDPLADITMEVFPISENPDILDYNLRMRKCLYEKESNKQYGEFLIKKYWMKNERCKIPNTHIDTFLRLVKRLNKSSRDDNKELSDILTGIIKQKDEEYLELKQKCDNMKEILQEASNTTTLLSDLLRIHRVEQTIVDVPCLVTKIRKCLHPEEFETESSEDIDTSCQINVPMPITMKDMRRVLEGKYSFMSNIPIPPIHLDRSGYAYVLPSDILKLSVSFGASIEIVYAGNNFDPTSLHQRSVYRSPSIQKIVTDIDDTTNCIVVVFGMWSDGCYCGTESKGRRNTAKMITIHIAHHRMKREHVFPIALGRTKDNDDHIKRILIEDINMLTTETSICYIPLLKKSMPVAFRLGYVIQDRPEHADTTGFMSSGGTYSKKVGYSCPIEVSKNNFVDTSLEDNVNQNRCKLLKQLSSCDSCTEARITAFSDGNFRRSSMSSTRCPSCYDWSLSSVRYHPPSEFPLNDVPDVEKEGTCLVTKDITFRSMKECCQLIFKMIYLKEWRKDQALLYSRRECIRTSIVESVYQHARTLRQQRRPGDENVPDLPDDILPPFWNQDFLAIDHFLLGVMHYLFLNVGSHILFCVRDKLCDDNIWTTTQTKWNRILEGVRSLSISWCKCWTLGLTDKPASMWVSENYLGFSIVAKSLATSIRGVDGGETYQYVRLIEDVMMTYSSLVNVVMSQKYPDDDMLNRVDTLAKLLLSFVEELDNNIIKSSNNKIETASCFVNLLGLKKKMELFGIIRNFWEGGVRGEGIFLPLKESINRGFNNRGVCKTVLVSQYQTSAITELITFEENIDNFLSFDEGTRENVTNEATNVDSDVEFDRNRYRKYYCYKDSNRITSDLMEHNPISVAWYIVERKLFAIVGRRTKKKYLQELEMDSIEYDVKATMVFNLQVTGDVVEIESKSVVSDDYLSCLAIPLTYCLIDEEDNVPVYNVKEKYYIVNKNHEELSRNETFTFSSIMKRNNTGTYQGRDHRDVFQTVATLTDEEKRNCKSREWCLSFVGKPVNPIINSDRGIVTHFSYQGGHVTEYHAKWKVKFYIGERRRAVATKEYVYTELKRIIRL